MIEIVEADLSKDELELFLVTFTSTYPSAKHGKGLDIFQPRD